jgi:hypothetical protein
LFLGLVGVLAGFYLLVVLRVAAKDEAALLSGLTQMGFIALAGGAVFAGARRLRGAARELGNLAVAAFAILAAENAERALSICAEKNGAIDLVLTDVIMPGMNGKELAEKLHAEYPRLRFLFMSGYTGTAAIQHGPLENKAGFLAKPFTAESLCGTVRRILDGRAGTEKAKG